VANHQGSHQIFLPLVQGASRTLLWALLDYGQRETSKVFEGGAPGADGSVHRLQLEGSVEESKVDDGFRLDNG